MSIEAVTLEPLKRTERETTLVRARGNSVDGFGEDVTHDASDGEAFRRFDLGALNGTTTLGQALERLSAFDLSGGATHAVVASYRRWAIESALIDLALMQAGLSLSDVLGLPTRPVRFVVSPTGDGRGAVAAMAGSRLKLDPRSSWTRADLKWLASVAAVDIFDLKGTYPGTAVYQPPDARLYHDVLEVFPAAWLEDPALTETTVEVLRPAFDRIAWDEPVQEAADVDRLRPVAAVNLKPSRLGSLAALLEVVARCRDRGITMYGGGQSEIGPGRGQIQLLAALFYPDGPNDVAPTGWDDPSAEIVRSSERLAVAGDAAGFRSGWPR